MRNNNSGNYGHFKHRGPPTKRFRADKSISKHQFDENSSFDDPWKEIASALVSAHVLSEGELEKDYSWSRK